MTDNRFTHGEYVRTADGREGRIVWISGYPGPEQDLTVEVPSTRYVGGRDRVIVKAADVTERSR